MRDLLIITILLASFSVSGKADHAVRHNSKQQQDKGNEQRKNEKPNQPAEKPSGANNIKIPNALKRVKEIKTAYITKKLDLTPEQSGKFWPLYNEYQEELFAIQKQIRINNSPLVANGKDQIINGFALDDKKNNIKRHYAQEFLKIMPPEKVSLIAKSEREFQDEVIRSMKERKSEADN